MLNAWTLEIDDPEVAVGEILGQLDLENSLLARSAGFITCSYDYVESGMVRAVCEALPFAVVGGTTLTNAVNGEGGAMLFCLTVLTADDCSFAVAGSEPLSGNYRQAVGKAWADAAARLEDKPGLALAFFPMLGDIGGELILEALDEAAGGTPVFGTIACDFDTALYRNTFTILNGECMRDRMAMLVISGNVRPRFVVTATSEQNLHKQQAVITASEGSILREINGMSAESYFRSIGMAGGMEGVSSVPFVVNYNDGTQPVARAIYSLNEDGSAVCGGRMPEGGTLSIGRMDEADILLTAEQSLGELAREEGVAGIIMFPCLGRNMVLGSTPLAEVDTVQNTLNGLLPPIPWHLAYSGGEVCPVHGGGGGVVNRFHNFTFIACAL